jgi:ribonucleoside-diphosphate reductase alpha chain
MFSGKIKKRDGRIVDFDATRIRDAVHKAFLAVELSDGSKAEKVTHDVIKALEEKFKEQMPSVEDVQDAVIDALNRDGYLAVALAYEDFRSKKEELRKLRGLLGVEPKLTVNAMEILKARYLQRDEQENFVETPTGLFERVAKAIAVIDANYGQDPAETEKTFYEIMAKLEFLPNTPTLFNAGTKQGQLAACFVLPVEDSLESIFTTVKNMALIEQTGGGVGFDFSHLRPRGDLVRSTKGVASGPVSFMRVFDVATEVIKAGGKRRGAMMAILRVDHPDILEFITAKQAVGVLSNFNVSVAVTGMFLAAVESDSEYPLINPRNGEVVKQLRARDVWGAIAASAWASGDPGVVFIDEINRLNPTPQVGKIESTNPCGEVPLLPYESCNLGSVNLSKMVTTNQSVDWEKLRQTVRNGVHFLDNVVDANVYPLIEIGKVTQANRKIGLGVMGFADMLIMLGVPYDSDEAVKFGEQIMEFIEENAHAMSAELATQRGAFPNFAGSIWSDKYSALRNATATTVAPTGTISIIAGCSSGIEPLFAVSFMRNVLGGARLFETNGLFEQVAKERGFYSAELLEEVARTGSVQHVRGVPEDVKRVFVTALDIAPVWHVRMQAAFQRHVDNAVSKTVNLPHSAKVEDVKAVYNLAAELKCKGVTVFRYGSKSEQVLYIGQIQTKQGTFVSAQSEYAGGCPTQNCPFPS